VKQQTNPVFVKHVTFLATTSFLSILLTRWVFLLGQKCVQSDVVVLCDYYSRTKFTSHVFIFPDGASIQFAFWSSQF